MLTPNLRAVAFDAGGTLLVPHPPAAVTYAEIGRRYGSRLSPGVIAPRFKAAFHRQELLDAARGQRTDERREEERWRRIVAEVLDDLTDFEGCFRELFEHYRRPEAWRCPEDTAHVLEVLHEHGCTLALASNYDRRLHTVAAGLPALRRIEHVVISSEVGWRKPGWEFFAALCRQLCCLPAEVLFVGDDLINDYEGARAAGMEAVLFDPKGAQSAGPARIGSLRELLADFPGHKYG